MTVKIKGLFNQTDFINHVLIFLIMGGGALAVYQFFYNKGLWLDEAWLAISILEKGFFELSEPLDNIQIAPIGFLYVEKFFVTFLGESDMVLSIFPLLGFLGSIPLFYFFTALLFKDKVFALFSTALFAFNPHLIYYSSEVKQYSTDVFFTLLILYSYVSFSRNNQHYLFLMGVSLSVFFSNISIFILLLVGILFLFTFNISLLKKTNYKISLILFTWGVVVLIYFFSFLYNHPSKAEQIEFWNKINGFIPISSGFIEIFNYFNFFIIPTFKKFIPILNQTRLHNVPLFLLALGILLLLFKKKYLFLYIFFSVVVFHLSASALKLYPFASRLVNYMVPLFVVVLSFSLYISFCFLKKYITIPRIVLCLPIILMFLSTYKQFPFKSKSNVREAIGYLHSMVKNDDIIYFEKYGGVVFLFYKKVRFAENQIVNKAKVAKFTYKKVPYQYYLSKIKSPSWLILDQVWGARIPENDDFTKSLEELGLKLLKMKKFDVTYCYYVAPINN